METGEKSQPHLSLGSLIRLDLGLARRDTWFTAAWAAMCGAVASGGLTWRRETAVTLALTLFLADPLMGAVCSALGNLPSPTLSKASSSNPGNSAAAVLPAPLFGPLTVGLHRLRRALQRTVAAPLVLLRPPVLLALVEVGVGLLAALMIALILGSSVTLIVSLGLGLALLRFILLGRRSVESPWQRGLLEVGLAWFVGFAALYDAHMFPPGGFYRIQAWQWQLWEHYGWEPLAVAALYVVAYGAWLALKGTRWQGAKLWLLNTAQMTVVGLLVAQHRPILATVAALLLLGQMLFQPRLRAGQKPLWYWKGTQFLLMASLLIASLALADLWHDDINVAEDGRIMEYQRIVVKLGTSVLTAGADHLSRPRMVDLVRQVAALHERGCEVIVVSSGAIMAGREALGFPRMDKDIPFKQVLAAVGQGQLMHLYEQLFDLYSITVAQALLTRDDLADRGRYLNARNTLLALLARRVVPIVNENDVVAVDEIKIGDNDTLSALVANLVDADLLVMLTDTAGLFTADPRLEPDAELIREVPTIDQHIREIAGDTGTNRGTGGMATKIEAARLATRSGTEVIIAAGDVPDVLLRIFSREAIGTRFSPTASKVESRKRWILSDVAEGCLRVDAGAARALIHQGKSLLPVGVVAVEGDFRRGETVRILDIEGREIARGIANYGSRDLAVVKGHHSNEIVDLLGYEYGEEVVHRNDLVLL